MLHLGEETALARPKPDQHQQAYVAASADQKAYSQSLFGQHRLAQKSDPVKARGGTACQRAAGGAARASWPASLRRIHPCRRSLPCVGAHGAALNEPLLRAPPKPCDRYPLGLSQMQRSCLSLCQSSEMSATGEAWQRRRGHHGGHGASSLMQRPRGALSLCRRRSTDAAPPQALPRHGSASRGAAARQSSGSRAARGRESSTGAARGESITRAVRAVRAGHSVPAAHRAAPPPCRFSLSPLVSLTHTSASRAPRARAAQRAACSSPEQPHAVASRRTGAHTLPPAGLPARTPRASPLVAAHRRRRERQASPAPFSARALLLDLSRRRICGRV
jgi:hypothetical protein